MREAKPKALAIALGNRTMGIALLEDNSDRTLGKRGAIAIQSIYNSI